MEVPLRTLQETEYESAPRGYESTRAHSRISLYFLKISGFLVKLQYAVAYVAGGLSGLPSSSEGSGGRGATALPFRSRGARDPTVVPRFWPFECNLQSSGTLARRPFYILHFTFYTLSARWRVLCAALRRAIASRKAVPADIKDQHPASSLKDKT